MKPTVNVAAEAKYATKRRSAAPNGGGPSSPATTLTPTIILPMVCPPRQWSTDVYAPAKTRVKNDARGLRLSELSRSAPDTRAPRSLNDEYTTKNTAKSMIAASARIQKPAGRGRIMARIISP